MAMTETTFSSSLGFRGNEHPPRSRPPPSRTISKEDAAACEWAGTTAASRAVVTARERTVCGTMMGIVVAASVGSIVYFAVL